MKIIYLEDATEEWRFQVDHVSEDPDFTELPLRSFILKSCGDGLSSLALENEQNVLLLVSNVFLVTSKVKQYVNTQFTDDPSAEYPARERFSGEVFGVWQGVTSEDVEDYIHRCQCEGTPLKVMCTYDSMVKLEAFLDDYFDVIAVDEADMLQEYAQLKAIGRKRTNKGDAITRLYDMAEEYEDKVVFFSATTMGETYLPEWVNDFRQIRIVTPNVEPPTPMLMKRRKPFSALKREVILPIKEKGFTVLADRTIKKCIICINSVENITRLVRECNLQKDEYGIICGQSHRSKVATGGRNGDVDLNNIPRFLFLTSSAWRGIDIHDEEAMTFIVSCTDKSYHMVPVDTQLLQCVRRQRSKSNIHYDRYVFLYNTSQFDMTEEELLKVWEADHKRFESNIRILNELLEAGDTETYEHTLETFDHDSGFVKFVNFQQGRGLVLNENLFKALLHRILVVRRSFTEDSSQPVEGMLPVYPVFIPDPGGGDPCSFTTLKKLFAKQKKTEKDLFSEVQKNSDNYKIISKYQEIYGKLPPRLDTARLKLAYAADNMPAQYQVDMLSPFINKKGKRISSEALEKHMRELFRQYNLSESTDMPTIIAALEENGVELRKKKSSIIYYEILSVPDITTQPV